MTFRETLVDLWNVSVEPGQDFGTFEPRIPSSILKIGMQARDDVVLALIIYRDVGGEVEEQIGMKLGTATQGAWFASDFVSHSVGKERFAFQVTGVVGSVTIDKLAVVEEFG